MSAAPNRVSSRTTRRRARTRTRTPGTWTGSRSPTWARSARPRPTTTSTCSRRCRSRPAAPIPPTPTPGVQLNFVLRGGTSKWRGTTRYYFENDSLQSDNVSSDLFGQIASYNRVGEYKDWGFEGGGPIIPRRLFAWGAYGKTEPEINVFSFDPDLNDYRRSPATRRTLENISAKITGELSPKTRANFTYFRGNKQKFGRGASGFRPDETTYNQDGPTDLYKFEAHQTIGSQPVPRRPLRAHEERLLARAARRPRRPVLSRRFDRVSRVVRVVPDAAAAAQRLARGQHVQGPARPEVRVRLEARRASRPRAAGRATAFAPTTAATRTCRRASSATGRSPAKGQVLERLPRRYDQLRPADAERRRPLGPRRELGGGGVGPCQPGPAVAACRRSMLRPSTTRSSTTTSRRGSASPMR